MGKEDLSLIPYSGEQPLGPPHRRFLTRAAVENPLLYEVSSVIPLDSAEVAQIAYWANNASIAIASVAEILISQPGEITTHLKEHEETDTTKQTDTSSETHEHITVRGFFTVRLDRVEDTFQDEKSQSKAKKDRTSAQTARIRPAQFLTGSQLSDALNRVAIARGEGLLLLPADNSELNRRQGALVSITKRLVRDHRQSNPDWADDIQEGTINGLISQLEQTSSALVAGYLQNDIQVSENVQQSIHQQLIYDLESEFSNLIEFSLLITARISALVKIDKVLRKVVLVDILPNYPSEATILLDKWREIFARDAQGENASLMGISFGEILATSILRSQDRQDRVFDDLTQVALKSAEVGGAKLLLHSFNKVSKSLSPNQDSAEVYTEIISFLKDDDRNFVEDSIAAAIKLLATTGNIAQIKDTIESLLDRYANYKEEVSLAIKAKNRECSWRSLSRLIDGLDQDVWQIVKQLVKPETASWEVVWKIAGTLPQQLEEIHDPEIVEAIRDFFKQTIQKALTEYSVLGRFDLINLSKMYRLLEQTVREELTKNYLEKAEQLVQSASVFLHTHQIDITQLAANKIIWQKLHRLTKKDDSVIIRLSQITDAGFNQLPIIKRMSILEDIVDRLNSYKEIIDGSQPRFNPLSSRALIQAKTIAKRTIKTDEFDQLSGLIPRFYHLGEVFYHLGEVFGLKKPY